MPGLMLFPCTGAETSFSNVGHYAFVLTSTLGGFRFPRRASTPTGGPKAAGTRIPNGSHFVFVVSRFFSGEEVCT
eukprot:4715722-Pyramimonas_sp.AAC.1